MFVSTTLAAPDAYRGGQTMSSIRMHPTNGRTLYVANRGRGTEIFRGEPVSNGAENTISVFSVDAGTGESTLVQTIDTHSIAVRTMAFQPNGRSMVAASPEPGQVRAGGRLETVPAALTLYHIEADGRLAFRSTLPVDTRGEAMSGPGWFAIDVETRHGAGDPESFRGHGHRLIEGCRAAPDAMLKDPAPRDWLMWRRTQNGWGYCPLDQVNPDNAGDRQLVWTRAWPRAPSRGPGWRTAASC